MKQTEQTKKYFLIDDIHNSFLEYSNIVENNTVFFLNVFTILLLCIHEKWKPVRTDRWDSYEIYIESV